MSMHVVPPHFSACPLESVHSPEPEPRKSPCRHHDIAPPFSTNLESPNLVQVFSKTEGLENV